VVATVDQASVGSRLRTLRKLRGLTQHQLAGRTHFSTSLVKKIEQGSVPPSSAFVANVARVLGVKPAHLYGTDERDAAEAPRVENGGIGELRAALDAWDDPRPEGDPLTLDQIARRLTVIGDHVYGTRALDGGHELANLFHHLFLLADRPDHRGARARAALWDGYRIAASLAGRFRQFDLAAIASERHVQLAPATDDPLRVAVSAYHRSTRHLQFGDFRAGLRALDRARAYLDTTPAGRAVEIQLDLRSAVLAARSGDVSEADGFIAEARRITADQRTPLAAPYPNIDASPLNIAVHWCAVPVENYDSAEAVRRARQVQIVDRTRPERVAHHHIDMARAWLLYGDRDQVLANLNTARRTLPAETRRHPAVRETVLALAESDRRTTDSLASFARWAGIDL
jgi:transcriptional regulator with XRE-family HTH domain